MHFRNCVAALACIMLSACATIVTGNKQAIKVDSNPPGAKVFTAVKSNKEGKQSIVARTEAGITPTTVTIERKDGAIFVEKDGYQPAEIPLNRGMNPWVFGDIVLTSPLSTSIDTSTGAASQYDPSEYIVELQPVAGAGTFQTTPRPTTTPAPATPIPMSAPAAAPAPAATPAPAPAAAPASEKKFTTGRTINTTNILSKADASAQVRKSLPPGANVRLISRLQNATGAWWYVVSEDERSGWVRESELELH